MRRIVTAQVSRTDDDLGVLKLCAASIKRNQVVQLGLLALWRLLRPLNELSLQEVAISLVGQAHLIFVRWLLCLEPQLEFLQPALNGAVLDPIFLI